MLRASIATALTLACLDAHAEVKRNCIATLEARPSSASDKPAPTPGKPCPVAVAYTKRDRAAQGNTRDAAIDPSPLVPSLDAGARV
jgi:hypothetical protein